MIMSNNIFEYATRNKIRYATPRGEVSVEQLWDIPLRSSTGLFDLNAIAKAANKANKEMTEENYVDSVRTPGHVRAEMALEVVKHVIATKLADEAAASKRAENTQEKERLLAILAEKQDKKLTELDEEDLKKRIAVLETVS
jgi:hypothetical protein